MLTEDYCDFETAKLLKEKGFKTPVETGYYGDGRICHNLALDFMDYNHEDGYYSRPTIQMAMKWLREVHNLHIMVNCIGKVNYDPIIQSFDGKDFEIDGVEVGITKHIDGKYINVRRGFKTYENACEAAIKYCLINLI